MSQLLVRLNQELEVATEPILVAELAARKAAALARLGRSAEAAETVKHLRQINANWTHARAHVWIMLAEGILIWHRDLSHQALDRITRAQVLSIAMGYDKAIAISSAWKAHIEFEISSFIAMFTSIRLALKHAQVDDSEAHVRVAIDICNVLYVCGDWEAAKVWFLKGRKVALSDGDQASIEALQYNRAVFSLMWARIEWFDGRTDAAGLRSLRLETNSARNLQELTRNTALRNHLGLWEARLCVMEGHFALALEGLTTSASSVPFASSNFNASLISLEIAYCQYKIGRAETAIETSRQVENDSLAELDIDDRFVASCMLLEMSAADPRFGSPELLASQHHELREAYLKSRSDLTALVKKFCDETLGPREAV